MNIIVCGAGLGGLSAAISCALAGHRVTILEAAKELTEITPNGARLLRKWGLGQDMDRMAAVPTTCTVHRYSGEILAFVGDFDGQLRHKFHETFQNIHRADLQQALYRRATELGVRVLLNHRVTQIHQQVPPSVVVESGEILTGDLVVGADGLWSRCREVLLDATDKPLPTGDLAYRIVLTADQIEDPKLKEWITQPQLHFWIGNGAHVVAYSLRAGTMANIVLLCPDNLPDGVSRQHGSVAEMKELFADWDPVLTQFLSHVEQVDKWKLMHRTALDTWSNADKTMVLMGDACHPMLPYLAQGANSSLEDGAALGTMLAHFRSPAQLPRAIDLYEQRAIFHLPDGPEQRARDEVFKAQLGKPITSPFPSKWTDPDSQEWLYGYDAYAAAQQAISASENS